MTNSTDDDFDNDGDDGEGETFLGLLYLPKRAERHYRSGRSEATCFSPCFYIASPFLHYSTPFKSSQTLGEK